MAKWISWGLDPGEDAPAVAWQEFREQVASLSSPSGEERVRAARWLGDHGVGTAGSSIAGAMWAPGTQRPCQLAHSLGQLGDQRWVPVLVLASKQTANRDLRACAKLALGDLASAEAVDELMAAFRRGVAPAPALHALAEIASPSSEAFFQEIVTNPRTEDARRIAARGLQRTRVLMQEDPVPALLELVQSDGNSRLVDRWAFRRLAIMKDERGIPALAAALALERLLDEERVEVAAALAWLGTPAEEALREDRFPAELEPLVAAAVQLSALQ